MSERRYRIVMASDHAGANLKAAVAAFLREHPAVITVEDVFGAPGERSDYPVAAETACRRITEGAADLGVLVCGSGVGIAIAANKCRGIRAVCAPDVTTARLSREHNDCNVLTLGERLTGVETAYDIVRAFLAASFQGGRHADRVALLARLEGADRA